MAEKRVRKKYVKVRMDDELYEALRLAAKANHRPMTRQVEAYISDGILREKPPTKPLVKAGDDGRRR